MYQIIIIIFGYHYTHVLIKYLSITFCLHIYSTTCTTDTLFSAKINDYTKYLLRVATVLSKLKKTQNNHLLLKVGQRILEDYHSSPQRSCNVSSNLTAQVDWDFVTLELFVLLLNTVISDRRSRTAQCL